MITKEQVWKGLKLELSLEQLEGIFQAEEYEKDYYYDFDLLKQVVEKAIEKQIDFGYFLFTNYENVVYYQYRLRKKLVYI